MGALVVLHLGKSTLVHRKTFVFEINETQIKNKREDCNYSYQLGT